MKIKNSEFYSYDSKRNNLLCKGRIALMHTLKLMLPSEINIRKTLRDCRLAGFVDTKGKPHNFRNYALMFDYLEHEYKLPIRANKCYLKGIAMVSPLFVINLKSIPEKLQEVVEVKEIEEKAVDAEVKDFLNNRSVDLEYAKALYDANDLTGSKNKLAEYAASFDIQLKKNKSFDNMIADLEK